ncbi:tryptophan synthase beta subunit-like PLP-dependent enzyme [Marasmius fiardii PR-910]|nr:tryptophan synthase beta subunit-like PLP-dependent enzyme [Marasmius fiardii PR-910]
MSTNSLPLTRSSVEAAHKAIAPYIHRTPVLTSRSIDTIVSTPQSPQVLIGTPWEGQTPSSPKLQLFFKCENFQKVGAFKARGAFHALSRLTEEEVKNGVVTHSSGNHAQALAYAARTRGVTAYIVMPSISTPSKIAATKGYGANVIFSGSTAPEREIVANDVIAKTGARFIHPYDHPDIILGQGTMALELEEQVKDLDSDSDGSGHDALAGRGRGLLDAVISPLGGGGMLSGIATALSGTGTRVFGSEPSFQGGDDGRRGLADGKRITSVSTLTIADGLRTPLGEINWTVISDKSKVEGVYSVGEEEIKKAMKLLLERLKIWVEPSSCVPLAVVFFDEDFRRECVRLNVRRLGVVLSGGNTTVEAVSTLFGPEQS